MIKAASDRRMQVHIWYSPWIYKDVGRAVELREHPEWAAVNAKGAVDGEGVCLARPEVRRFELDLMTGLIERYPDLAGIHIEEPATTGAVLLLRLLQAAVRDWYDLDIAADTMAARPLLDHLAAAACTDFMIRLRQALLAARPQAWLSANGSAGRGQRRLAHWSRLGDLARRGYIDFYVPQIYTQSIQAFNEVGSKTKELLGECDLITGLAVSWSGSIPSGRSQRLFRNRSAPPADWGPRVRGLSRGSLSGAAFSGHRRGACGRGQQATP